MVIIIHKSNKDIFAQALSKAIAELIASLDKKELDSDTSPPETKGKEGDAA